MFFGNGLTTRRIPRVGQGLCQSRRQTEPVIHLPQQYDTAIAGHRAATKFCLDLSSLTAWKFKH